MSTVLRHDWAVDELQAMYDACETGRVENFFMIDDSEVAVRDRRYR